MHAGWVTLSLFLLATDPADLEHAREVNLNYVANLPNFLADETAQRFTRDPHATSWRKLDRIQTEISFKGSQAVRQQIRRDGKPWTQPFDKLPGFKWSGGFGSEIRPLFASQCPTTLHYEGRSQVRGRRLIEYSFASPADGCFTVFYFESKRYNPARTGRAFIDEATGSLMQLEEIASGFPSDFEFTHREEHVTWNYVEIADASYLLPVSATFESTYSSGARSRVEVEYTNHRHFQASSNLTFH